MAQDAGEAQEQRTKADQAQRQAGNSCRGEQLQGVVVRVSPGAGEIRRLYQRERLAKRAESGAEQRKAPDQAEGGVPRVDPHGPADVARQAHEPAKTLLAADQSYHREAGHGDRQSGPEPTPSFLARGEQDALGDHRHEPGDHSGARTGKRQAGEQQKPDDDRRRDPQQAALQLGFLARTPKRPPAPGEDHRQGQAEKERQVVGVDESSAQPFVGAWNLPAPDLVRPGEPSPGAVQHLEESRGDQGGGERPAAAAIPTGDAGDHQGRCDRGERERRRERFAGRERQRDRASGRAAQKLARGIEQANVARRNDSREETRAGEGLEQTEQGDPGERPGRPLRAAQGAGRFAARERQGEEHEDRDFEQRLAPRGDAAEGQRRPKQENRDRTGHQPFRLAYHRATVPRTPGRLHRRRSIRGRRSLCKIP